MLVCSWRFEFLTAGRSFDLLREASKHDVCPEQLKQNYYQKTSFDIPLSARITAHSVEDETQNGHRNSKRKKKT